MRTVGEQRPAPAVGAPVGTRGDADEPLATDPVAADRPAPRRVWVELAVIGVVALAVRVGYVFLYKHPVFVGGDAYWYHHGANLLVDGHGFIDAYRYHNGVVAQTADHPPLTIVVLAAASLFGMRSFFWHQLELCLLGSITVVVVAYTARQLAGRRAAIIAGLAAAVYPNLWFNDAMVMSETVVQLTTALAVLAAYRWWAVPGRQRAVVLGVAVAACALARAEAVLFVPLLVAPLILLDRRAAWKERVVEALVAALVAGAVLAPWVLFNLARFEQPVTISTGFDPTVAVSNCDDVYVGPLLGYWSRPCILRLPVPTHGDVSTQEAQYRKAALHYISTHKSRLPTVVAARIGRTWGLYRPVQQIRLDVIETREYQFSQVGLAMYYVLAVGTAFGCWVLRRRRIPISPILATIATVTFATAITFGQTRYRASAEPVLVLGAAVAIAAGLRPVIGSDPDGGPAAAEDPAGEPPGGGEPAPVADLETVLGGDLPRKHREFPCFDGLRAIAALVVIIVHTAFPSGFTTRNHRWGAFTARMEIGVAVFFVISGFLLYRPFAAAHLEGRPGPAVGPYLKRRLLRIVPAYWVALFITAFVLNVKSPAAPNNPAPPWDLKAVIIYFGFLQIYFKHYVLHGISAAWTLCVEMSFYLFLPVYAAAMAAWSRRWGEHRLRNELLGLGGLFAVCVAFRTAVFVHRTGQQTGAGTWLPAQLDLFALGMGLAVASVWWSEHAREPTALGRAWVPWASWGLALSSFWLVSHVGIPRTPIYDATLGQVFVRQWLYGVFGFFLVLPAVFGPQERGSVRRFLRSRVMVAIGLVSYGVYLWHETWMLKILEWLNRPLFQTSFLKLTLAVLAFTGVSAVISYVVVEQPFQRLGRRRRASPVREEPHDEQAPLPVASAADAR